MIRVHLYLSAEKILFFYGFEMPLLAFFTFPLPSVAIVPRPSIFFCPFDSAPLEPRFFTQALLLTFLLFVIKIKA